MLISEVELGGKLLWSTSGELFPALAYGKHHVMACCWILWCPVKVTKARLGLWYLSLLLLSLSNLDLQQ